MEHRLGRLFLTVGLAAGLLSAARAADLAIERPTADLPGADGLRTELEDVKNKLSPHSVLWLDSGQAVPPGFWGLTGWSLTDSGGQLQLKANFSRPSSTGKPPEKIATCLGRIGADGFVARDIVENCIHDLLNQTFFDPREGFVGYVKAPICEFKRDYDYWFFGLRLTAAGIEPGLTKIMTREWPTILLAMENPLGPDEPFLFSDAQTGYEGPFASLKALEPKDVLLRIQYFYSNESTEHLDKMECSGTPVRDRTLRFFLEQTPVQPSTFPLQDRTSPPGGGG